MFLKVVILLFYLLVIVLLLVLYLQVVILYLQVILSDSRDKAVLKASNDKEGGEDNVGEEGDEVGQLPIRLWINTIHDTRLQHPLAFL